MTAVHRMFCLYNLGNNIRIKHVIIYFEIFACTAISFNLKASLNSNKIIFSEVFLNEKFTNIFQKYLSRFSGTPIAFY